jgi:ubiquinone/menaquinone biosynthesis C-methylase UbiE
MYDRDADAYADLRAGALRAAGEHLVARLAPDNDDTVVDIACGTGTGIAALRRVAPRARLVGLDLSFAMLRHAPAGEFAVQADMMRLPLKDASADAALCCFALMHLPDPGRAVAEAARVLRPGGRFALATWAAAPPWPARAAVLAVLDDLGAPLVASTHVAGPLTESAAQLENLLRANGFGDIDVTTQRLDVAGHCLDVETVLRSWTSLGSIATRVFALDAETRHEFLSRARDVLAGYAADDRADPREVVFATGRLAR